MFDTQDFEAALNHFNTALEIYRAPSVASSRDVRVDVSDCYYWIGETHAAAAASPRTQASERRRHWLDARSAFQTALEINSGLVNEGIKFSPNRIPDQIKAQIAKCDAEISKKQ